MVGAQNMLPWHQLSYITSSHHKRWKTKITLGYRCKVVFIRYCDSTDACNGLLKLFWRPSSLSLFPFLQAFDISLMVKTRIKKMWLECHDTLNHVQRTFLSKSKSYMSSALMKRVLFALFYRPMGCMQMKETSKIQAKPRDPLLWAWWKYFERRSSMHLGFFPQQC